MTRLIVSSADRPADVLLDTTDFTRIASEMAGIGANVERWTTRSLPQDADAQSVLAAYAAEIDELKTDRGYLTADVIRIRPGNPNWPTMRQKFLAEHVHDEDEVRYFVEGSGAFYLHVGDRICEIVGEAGDLLLVPAGVKHWFDGGPDGNFTAIRLFTDEKGWIAHYTGDQIADSVPKYNGDQRVSSSAVDA
jgi:1,2-dihydroxy-3-keto-5-methylthiopentene dioxygenase